MVILFEIDKSLKICFYFIILTFGLTINLKLEEIVADHLILPILFNYFCLQIILYNFNIIINVKK